MKEKLIKYYEDLPTWSKGVVAVGGLVAIFFIGKSVLKKFKEEQSRLKALKQLQNSKNELQSIKNNGIPSSYPKSSFDGWANQLADEFSGCDFSNPPFGVVLDYYDLSTSGKKIYDIISKLNNNRDFLELVDSFGIRTYDSCGFFTGNEENVNLYAAINNELQAGEIKFINQKLRERSITYPF